MLEFLGYWYAILHSTRQVNIYDTCITNCEITKTPSIYVLTRA